MKSFSVAIAALVASSVSASQIHFSAKAVQSDDLPEFFHVNKDAARRLIQQSEKAANKQGNIRKLSSKKKPKAPTAPNDFLVRTALEDDSVTVQVDGTFKAYADSEPLYCVPGPTDAVTGVAGAPSTCTGDFDAIIETTDYAEFEIDHYPYVEFCPSINLGINPTVIDSSEASFFTNSDLSVISVYCDSVLEVASLEQAVFVGADPACDGTFDFLLQGSTILLGVEPGCPVLVEVACCDA